MMRDAAESLDFEKAIAVREQIKKLNERLRGHLKMQVLSPVYV